MTRKYHCNRDDKDVSVYDGCFQVVEPSNCEGFVEHPDYINRDHSRCKFLEIIDIT